jgi:hypothetical protein
LSIFITEPGIRAGKLAPTCGTDTCGLPNNIRPTRTTVNPALMASVVEDKPYNNTTELLFDLNQEKNRCESMPIIMTVSI